MLLVAAVAVPSAFAGIPVTNFTPASGLLAPGTESLTITFETPKPASCRFSTAGPSEFASMQRMDDLSARTSHRAIVPISPDPAVLTRVLVRCDSNPEYVHESVYRAVPLPAGKFPRIANIWWGWRLYATAPAEAAKVQLYLAPGFGAGQTLRFRSAHPGILMLGAVNAQETVPGGFSAVADRCYLKDTRGRRIEPWPGEFVLNLTRPGVPELLAEYAGRVLEQAQYAYDGVFFDNFVTSISWLRRDVGGRSIDIDADGDGRPDNPAALDAAWRAGAFRLIDTFHKIAPHAYVSAHLSPLFPAPDLLDRFNGESILFDAVNVREGTVPEQLGLGVPFTFESLWSKYFAWFDRGQRPVIANIQASPPNQIAYGYGFKPLTAILPETVAFARSFYPNVRFGLCLTLMNDGFFSYDFGDMTAPVNWWYDEYDFDLGSPAGPSTRVPAASLVFRRDFTRGTVLLNATRTPQTVFLEPGFARFEGSQAPLFQYIVDDADRAFTAEGLWQTVTYDSGLRKLKGPFFHAWQYQCHRSAAAPGSARWDLGTRAAGEYEIEVWLPAAPDAYSWAKRAVYEVISEGNVVLSSVVDQRKAAAGDRWHPLGTVRLHAAAPVILRARNEGGGALIADAVQVKSAARYNDGSPTAEVTIAPMDGILLRRVNPAKTQFR
jgi:hypothetical protein